ncbi:aldose 1-epimerase family protein [Loigolactobacillus coryniformis]|jgi:galactose mutarotase-like enzyme|uniref:Aldose-1 epimerase n=4 Tax=Loigolactobacillus coryniformis TaxID=1610 RepID=A0A0R1FEW2_9LACO|nr:aldose 1-epimerase family protein [Loigolactobacillus coryniformis]MDT3392570.1 aldose 1-epimerase family protein [Bacillota bacterium]RRG06607.1 MAG: aldose 1-epimerase family protein [Lactobacillus sp.]ATO43827.1 aldose epimerase [Loigolactobacillus coryniformis subsp. torquens DSM 20004 = KCTC 3535]ATO55508.1 aldose epimerase [Loigolactobacillus coryniformis subsp. coryniformis KCTC 3167 = DSM 20001]EJN55933.1 Putative aldose-1 epimerase [Loigolactobacillus coryniformis subsp. coryniform
MSLSIKNQFLQANFTEKGAELTNLISLDSGTEYIWQADPQIWGRHAPILFPFVGRLKNDEYHYQGKTYHMGQHGFARDRDFKVVNHEATTISFQLTDDEQSWQIYPFAFELTVTYQLVDNELEVTYFVHNPAEKEDLYFSVGGHPGFNIPLTDENKFEDYYISYEPKKSRVQIPLVGPFNDAAHKTLASTDTDHDLSHDLFSGDALIYELHQPNTFTLKNDHNHQGISVSVPDAPYTGIWSPYPTTGNFVCIEPWWGIADNLETSGELTEKMGINQLAAGADFTGSFTITAHQRRAF